MWLWIMENLDPWPAIQTDKPETFKQKYTETILRNSDCSIIHCIIWFEQKKTLSAGNTCILNLKREKCWKRKALNWPKCQNGVICISGTKVCHVLLSSLIHTPEFQYVSVLLVLTWNVFFLVPFIQAVAILIWNFPSSLKW